MSEIENTITTRPSLKSSDLYTLARATPLLQELIPDINILAPTELIIEEEYPRAPEQADHTRIFIGYTNLNGNTFRTMFIDPWRLNSDFPIDDFLAMYQQAISDGVEFPVTDPKQVIEFTLRSCICYSAAVVVGLEEKDRLAKAILSLRSIVSIIFDDPLDVFINIKDEQLPDTDHPTPMLTHMWKIKNRT